MTVKLRINRKLLNLIESQIKDIEYFDRIPLSHTLDIQVLKQISDYFNKKLISPEVIRSQIVDETFSASLLQANKAEGKDTKIAYSSFTGINFRKIARQIYVNLTTLPIKYTFILKLPKSTHYIPETKINNSITLMSVNDQIVKDFGLNDDDKPTSLSAIAEALKLGKSEKISFLKNEVLIFIKGYGYVSDYGLIKSSIIDPLNTLKVIVGLFYSVNVIEPIPKYFSWTLPRPYSYYAFNSKTKKLIRRFDESTNDNDFIQKMEFQNETFELTKLDVLIDNKSTKFDNAIKLLKKIYTPTNQLIKIKRQRMKKIQTILKNALYWYYETLKIADDHIRVVYLTTAFDALLGAVDEENMKREIKAEIISSSAAKNALDALEIKEVIVNLYKLRNKIVHGEQSISAFEKLSEEAANDMTLTKSLFYFNRFINLKLSYFCDGIKSI